MTDNIKIFNEHRLIKEIDHLSKNYDIIKFANWVNKNVTEDFLSKPEQK
jgi:hypothetical protein|tara:strand:- start:1 stop:147 length:147 start_codon:yes stop_codon:yes gene_type:complete